ncbi:glucose-1-phosphate adenylyltransferase-like isoform 2-T2 [Discoglossus pictus]
MKAVILAAGYGTRLLRDLQNDTQGRFRHLIGLPKPLLPIGRLPLISYWVEALRARNDVSDIFVIGRLGAVSCLQLVIDKFNVNDPVIVIGGDTLFFEDFHLQDVLSKFEKVLTSNNEANLVLSYNCKNEETQRYGILETDENSRVTALREKPSAEDTASRQACPCFYVLSKHSLPLVQVFLEEKKKAPIEEKDAPGHLLSWLVKRNPVYVHPISGRFDVGNLESYIICNKYFQENIKDLQNYLQ